MTITSGQDDKMMGRDSNTIHSKGLSCSRSVYACIGR